MKWKCPKQTILTILLLTSLTLQFCLLSTVKADTLLVYGSNFNIYSETNGKFGFQHPPVPYECLGDNITLTITAGTLNGTEATLTMYSSSGILTFTNQNNITIDLAAQQDGTRFWINGAETNTATLTALSTYRIEWSILEPEFWLPLMFILGMFGLASMFGGPLYAIHLFKHHEYRDAFVNGTLITAVGFALVIAWLWA